MNYDNNLNGARAFGVTGRTPKIGVTAPTLPKGPTAGASPVIKALMSRPRTGKSMGVPKLRLPKL